jgi:hypothetical protein
MKSQGDKMKVAVYWNLHKKLFSIQSRKKENYGKVINYVNSVVINSLNFVVRKSGREKVLKENSKNVHAFVIGTLEWFSENKFRLKSDQKLVYDLYKYEGFVIADTKEQISKAWRVTMSTYNKHPVMEVFQ